MGRWDMLWRKVDGEVKVRMAPETAKRGSTVVRRMRYVRGRVEVAVKKGAWVLVDVGDMVRNYRR